MVATKISSIIPVALFGVTDKGVNPTVTATGDGRTDRVTDNNTGSIQL
jgi:hypothetical protein